MGLFSSRRHQPSIPQPAQTNNHSKIHVLVRSQATGDVGDSSEPRSTWSICVEQPSTRHGSSSYGQMQKQPRKTKSIFNLNRKDSHDSTSSHTSNPTSQLNPGKEYIEFSLQDGNLQISRPTPRISIQAPDGHTHTHNDPILLQIQIPLSQPSSQATHSPLSLRTESTLYSMSAANSSLTNADTDCWLRFALIALQHAAIIPPGAAFNVNDFTTYAENKLTEFEAEVLAAVGEEGDVEAEEHVRTLDYQRHLDDNARLRAMFSSGSAGRGDEAVEGGDGVGNGNGNETRRGRNGEKTKSGWWVSRPQSNVRRGREVDSDSPYGGLM